MDDLISRKAAIEWFFRPYSNEESYSNLDVEKALKAIPAVDAAPVVHARWYGGELGTCGACGYDGCASDIWSHVKGPGYCPNCGAEMDADQHLASIDQSGAKYADNPTV